MGHRRLNEPDSRADGSRIPHAGGACIRLVLDKNVLVFCFFLVKACDVMQHLVLPSDGSGTDPHATRLVVRPVAQTGQGRAENRDGGWVGGGGGGEMAGG